MHRRGKKKTFAEKPKEISLMPVKTGHLKVQQTSFQSRDPSQKIQKFFWLSCLTTYNLSDESSSKGHTDGFNKATTIQK